MNETSLHRELNATQAADAITGAFARKLAGLPAAAPTPDYLRAMQAAGQCIQHLNRLCLSDLWAAYERMHVALGLPMDWQGATATTDALDLTRQLGYVLRSIDTPDALMALASSDRHFRAARVRAFRESEHDADMLTRLIDDHRDDQSTNGLLDQSGRVARLANLRASLSLERGALRGHTLHADVRVTTHGSFASGTCTCGAESGESSEAYVQHWFRLHLADVMGGAR